MQWNEEFRPQGIAVGIVAFLAVLFLGKTVFPLACVAGAAMLLFAGESFFKFSRKQLADIEANWDNFQGKGNLRKTLKNNKVWQAGKEHYLGQLAKGVNRNRHIGWLMAASLGPACWLWGEVLVLALVAGISANIIVKFAAGDPTIEFSEKGNFSAGSV